MGNSASKKALLEAAHQQLSAAEANLAARERDLARVGQDLESQKSEAHVASSEVAKLRSLIQELDLQFAAADDARSKEIERLSAQVRQKGNETLAQQQVSKLRTSERDEARRKIVTLEETVAKLEAAKAEALKAKEEQAAIEGPLRQRIQDLEAKLAKYEQEAASRLQDDEARKGDVAAAATAAEARAEEHRKALEAAQSESTETQKALAAAQAETRDVTEKLQALQRNNRTLAEELAAVKVNAANQLAQAQAEAAANLTVARAAAGTTAAAKQFSATRALAMRIWKLAKADAAASPVVDHSPRTMRPSRSLASLIQRDRENSSLRDTPPPMPALMHSPTPALTTATSSPSSSPDRSSLSASLVSTRNTAPGERDYSQPVPFSLYPRIGKDLRIEVGEGEEEVMVEIHEWNRGVRSFKVCVPGGSQCFPLQHANITDRVSLSPSATPASWSRFCPRSFGLRSRRKSVFCSATCSARPCCSNSRNSPCRPPVVRLRRWRLRRKEEEKE